MRNIHEINGVNIMATIKNPGGTSNLQGRENSIRSLSLVNARMCGDSSDGIVSKRCDCKYLNPGDVLTSCQTGCSELRTVIFMLENMTEEEYQLALSVGAERLRGSERKARIDRLRDKLDDVDIRTLQSEGLDI